mgnify:CR=1 FL=1
MKITKSHLDQIIREEIRAVRSEVNSPKKRKDLRHKSKTEKEREKPYEVFPGYDDRNGGLKQLSRGIVETEDDDPDLIPWDDDPEGKLLIKPEDEEENEPEEVEEACLGNSWRDAWGRFSSEADHEVVTHGYKGDNSSRDCDHGKWKQGKSGTSHKCGRSPSGKKHPYVCKTGQLREAIIRDEGVAYVSVPYLVKLLKTAEAQHIQENQAQKIAQICKKAGYQTRSEAFASIVKSINTIHRSMKGELFKPEKS